MTDESNLSPVRVVSSADQLRPLADRHDVRPVVEPAGDGEALRLESGASGEEAVSWERFFERLDETGQVVVYRPPQPESGDNPIFDVVSRDSVGVGGASREPPDGDAETLATSDTGDAEPVAYDTGVDSDQGTSDHDPEEAPVAPARDDEHAPTAVAEGLVLDEMHGAQTGTGRDLDDEYLVFENDGEQRVDLGGWVVYNEAGQSYRFPEGTTLAPGDQVTLHSESGSDSEGHLYWGAETPVWSERRDTITVETAAGEDVLEVAYEV